MTFLVLASLLAVTPPMPAPAGEFAHTKWCSVMPNHDPGLKQLTPAAQAVGLEPLFLQVAMVSEGFAIKDVPKPGMPMINGKPEFANILNGTAIGGFDLSAPGGYSRVADREAALALYSGDSWTDDGTDTFGAEFKGLLASGLLKGAPKGGLVADFHKLRMDQPATWPDYLWFDSSEVNEAATMRFKTEDLGKPYSQRRRVTGPTKGDPGRTLYKTFAAQVAANAAMWRLSQKKIDQMKASIPAIAKKTFAGDELVFWSKVSFNGGQGSQAAAYGMLKAYAAGGVFKNTAYLTTKPKLGFDVLYQNARYVLDTYKYCKTHPNG
ncbi:MAG: hypothetical protein JST92_26785 [Deltaproteobacteria bacterium]|nr:hypothetical protein [Deltaproteobacteria bacterium]